MSIKTLSQLKRQFFLLKNHKEFSVLHFPCFAPRLFVTEQLETAPAAAAAKREILKGK